MLAYAAAAAGMETHYITNVMPAFNADLESLSGPLRFEVWSPPINSPVADRFAGLEKDGGILAFIRASDRHKGSADIFDLPPALFRGRRLTLVAGGSIDEKFRARVQAFARK